MDLISMLYEQSPLFETREQFEQRMRGWDVEPVVEDGRVIGAFVVRGAELHFAKFDATPVGRRHLDRLAQVIREHGCAQTKTPKDDVRQRRFNERIGFVVTGEDEYDYTMRVERLRQGNKPCQSQP